MPLYRAKVKSNGEFATGVGYANGKLIVSFNGVREDRCTTGDYAAEVVDVDPKSVSIQIGNRNLFMALDVETGLGGDLIGDNAVLVWNSDMMNCSILHLNKDGSIMDYEINLDNYDFDGYVVAGIYNGSEQSGTAR